MEKCCLNRECTEAVQAVGWRVLIHHHVRVAAAAIDAAFLPSPNGHMGYLVFTGRMYLS